MFVAREVDETKDWISEKDAALNNDNYGHDLASVQALQRKHEGVERDLAALGEKVSGLLLEPKGELNALRASRLIVCSYN